MVLLFLSRSAVEPRGRLNGRFPCVCPLPFASCLLPRTAKTRSILSAALALAGPNRGSAGVFSNAVGSRAQVCKGEILEQGLS